MAKPFNEAEVGQAKQMLEIAYKAMKVSHNFRTGQFVRWKPGLKNKPLPAYGDAAVVIEVLTSPVFDRRGGAESESPLFREPLDLVLGLFTNNNEDFQILHFDSRRFEPFPG